jgi:hypothetical protein
LGGLAVRAPGGVRRLQLGDTAAPCISPTPVQNLRT